MSDSTKTITKSDLVESIYSKIGFSKKDSSKMVEMVFNSLKKGLKNTGSIKLSSFGNFIVSQKKERIGRNPQTGEQIKIGARKVLSFKPSQRLKDILNK